MVEGVSIVLRTNQEERLQTALSYLKNQTVTRVPWEVLLIVDVSSAGAARRSLSSSEKSHVLIRILEVEKPGLHGTWEWVLKEAKYEVLCFLDDGHWIGPNWVQVVSETFSGDPALGAAGCLCEPVFEESAPTWFEKFHSIYGILTESDFERHNEPFEYLNDAGLCVRTRALTQLVRGGFRCLISGRIDSHLSGRDKTELSLAIRMAGWNIRVEPRLRLQQFIPADRLTWRHLRRLHRSHEAARTLLDAYSMQNLSMRLSLKGRLAQLWWYQLGQSFAELVRQPLRVFSAVTSNGEGRQEVVEVEILAGRILGMLRLRSRYGWSRRHIRYAPWRLRRSEEYLRGSREAQV
jgi:hypothetical protein